jgi:hypothetical protein
MTTKQEDHAATWGRQGPRDGCIIYARCIAQTRYPTPHCRMGWSCPVKSSVTGERPRHALRQFCAGSRCRALFGQQASAVTVQAQRGMLGGLPRCRSPRDSSLACQWRTNAGHVETADEGEKHATPAHLRNPLCAVTSSGVGWEGVLKLLYPASSGVPPVLLNTSGDSGLSMGHRQGFPRQLAS